MVEISQPSKEQISELVTSQKKAKLEWVSTITKIPVEKIIACAEELGFIIDGDFIALPKQKEESPVDSVETEFTGKPRKEIRNERTKRRLILIFAIIIVIIAPLGILFTILTILCLIPCIDAWAIAICIILLIIGLTLGFFGIRILVKQIKRFYTHKL
ncbi:MAG: hypothetical protein FK732_06855 [Asgard group archaeon]|nr:hypothetical protein [Asgard group archaeon]